MAKYETPPPVRPLEKLITDFSYTNGLDPVNVFNDFLTYIIHGFSPDAPPLQSWKYKRQQNMKFMQMLTGWVRLMASRIKDDTSWYDPFGDLYMALVSKSAQQSQGQFFTPVHICDLMVLCTQTEEKKTGQRMSDPRKRKAAVGLSCTESGKLPHRGGYQPDLLPDDRMQHAHTRMRRGSHLP